MGKLSLLFGKKSTQELYYPKGHFVPKGGINHKSTYMQFVAAMKKLCNGEVDEIVEKLKNIELKDGKPTKSSENSPIKKSSKSKSSENSPVKKSSKSKSSKIVLSKNLAKEKIT